MSVPVLAIDGPGGSGKGTISSRVATALGWHLLDSGAIYRVAAVAARKRGLALDDAPRLADMARTLEIRFDGDRVYLGDADITAEVRTEQAGSEASRLAELPDVRNALLELQRGFREAPGLVADGRDMGTVVFTDAGCKIFLTASPEERARRRYKQLKEQGISVSLASLFSDIAERDARDASRTASPLKAAEDAVEIDTTGMTIDEVVQRVLETARERMKGI